MFESLPIYVYHSLSLSTGLRIKQHKSHSSRNLARQRISPTKTITLAPAGLPSDADTANLPANGLPEASSSKLTNGISITKTIGSHHLQIFSSFQLWHGASFSTQVQGGSVSWQLLTFTAGRQFFPLKKKSRKCSGKFYWQVMLEQSSFITR